MKTAQIIIYLYSSIYTAHKSHRAKTKDNAHKKRICLSNRSGNLTHSTPKWFPNHFAGYYPARTSKLTVLYSVGISRHTRHAGRQADRI